jgi:hypothetical protein
MKRRIAAATAAILLAATMSTSVFAASANISPATQSHAHNVASHWSLSWGSTSPYHVIFSYGNGYGLLWQNTTIVSASEYYTFSPCPGDPATYHQQLDVYDGWNNTNGTYKGYANDTSSATESTGTPC